MIRICLNCKREASGDLQRVVAAKTEYTPQNVGRRLLELENEYVVEVRYKKNYAFHQYRVGHSFEELNRRQLSWFADLPQVPEGQTY